MVTAPERLCGLKATIIGAAREGTALARFLVRWGAEVTLSDAKPAEALAQRLRGLEGAGLRLVLGCHPPEILDADVLFLSPGVPPTAEIVRAARERGLPISSEPRLFTQLCPARVVGVTGSSGKTTTTTLAGQMFRAGGRATWVGGNIGAPLIERLLEPERAEVAVMELSSFQLELFSPDYQGPAVEQRRSARSRLISLEGWSPPIAAVTNITPNHLDRHPCMADYVRAKAQILAHQGRDDWAVLNQDDAYAPELAACTAGRVLHFSLSGPVGEGTYLRRDTLLLRWDGREQALCRASEVQLRGQHNLANILVAACCALAGGVSVEAMRSVATTCRGVAHRLEIVRTWRGIVFVNDSIATSPERAMAGVRAFNEPLLLLAGGRDKHLPWGDWADLVLQRARVVVAFGEAAPLIERALHKAQARRGPSGATLHRADSLEQAVSVAAGLACVGDVVLLSPGGTSFDAFEDFEARGRRFSELVAAL